MQGFEQPNSGTISALSCYVVLISPGSSAKPSSLGTLTVLGLPGEVWRQRASNRFLVWTKAGRHWGRV